MEAIDVIEVHQLLALYGHIVDDARWDRFEELFTSDAVLDYTAAGSAPAAGCSRATTATISPNTDGVS
jgi:hypothetical protein